MFVPSDMGFKPHLKLAEKQRIQAIAEVDKDERPTYHIQTTGLTHIEDYLGIMRIC